MENSTHSYTKNTETLKKFSDSCDDRPSYLLIRLECGRYEPFTQGGLNQLPLIFLPAIAEVMEQFSNQEIHELKAEIERLKSTTGAECARQLLEAREREKEYIAVLIEARSFVKHSLVSDAARFTDNANAIINHSGNHSLVIKIESVLSKSPTPESNELANEK